MKAGVDQQRLLLELAEIDAELARIDHRTKNLPARAELEAQQRRHQEATDRLAVLGIAVEDIDAEAAKLESEIEAVRRREERDRAMLEGGGVNAKQLTELQHELQTLERRKSSLEDSLLDVMERREQLDAERAGVSAEVDELQQQVQNAQQTVDDALAELARTRQQRTARREELIAELDAELVALYERQRTRGGVGAGPLQGGRCGACQIEIDRGELARFSAAAEDDVLRCPECGAILLRVRGSGQ